MPRRPVQINILDTVINDLDTEITKINSLKPEDEEDLSRSRHVENILTEYLKHSPNRVPKTSKQAVWKWFKEGGDLEAILDEVKRNGD